MERDLFSALSLSPTARALLHGDEAHPSITGEALFFPYARGTLVLLRVMGLTSPGFLGFHIHEKGNCSTGGDRPFAAAGSHYDPHGLPHPWHAGDLPPLLATNDGVGLLAVYTDRFRPDQVVGRSVILHERTDDLQSQPSGNSGRPIACGVVLAI